MRPIGFSTGALAYGDFQSVFKVVCAKEGDSYTRYLVRMEEMIESLKIIDAAIENLPASSRWP